MARPLVTAADVAGPGEPVLPEGAILTPMARDVLRRRGLSPELLRRAPAPAPTPAGAPARGGRAPAAPRRHGGGTRGGHHKRARG
ncbi:MAG: hypothetical protein M9894_24175, partial [Planctomycetes bacterium]|nr:hypothetical protein [Planctomycetota bacterium]